MSSLVPHQGIHKNLENKNALAFSSSQRRASLLAVRVRHLRCLVHAAKQTAFDCCRRGSIDGLASIGPH